MMVILGILFLVAWLMAKFVWGVASMGIHLLLLAAIVAVVFHFVRSGAPRTTS
ncbi:MAG TPA: hypothetical protein VGM39_19250 [Kofleriaceae bacterium]|jgi:hypothetical protein